MMENRGRGRGFSVAWSRRVERLAQDINACMDIFFPTTSHNDLRTLYLNAPAIFRNDDMVYWGKCHETICMTVK